MLRRLLARLLPKPVVSDTCGPQSRLRALRDWTRPELEAFIAEFATPGDGHGWFRPYLFEEALRRRAERLLADAGIVGEELRRGLEWQANRDKIERLKHQVTTMREALEDRNRQLRATKLIVYCSGGCPGGVPDAEFVTEEVVAEAERNTKRLRQWWEGRKMRLALEAFINEAEREDGAA